MVRQRRCRICGASYATYSNSRLLRRLKHHHRLILARSCSTILDLLCSRRVISVIRVADEGSRGVVVRLWLSTPLLLVVQERYFTLIFPSELLEKLQPCREMLHKSVLDLIALGLLADLQKSLLKRRDWARNLRLMLLLHSVLLRVGSTGDGLGPLMRIRDR